MPETTSRKRHKTAPPPLTKAEIRFCQIWFESGHKKTHAEIYIEVGFPAKETAEATKSAAFRIVKKRAVREYVRVLQGQAADASMVSVEKVAQGLDRVAFADRRKIYDERGRIKLPKEWPDDVANLIVGIESKEIFEWVAGDLDENGKRKPRRKELVGYIRKVKFVSPVEGMKILAQWKKMVGDDPKPTDAPAEPLVVGGEAKPGVL